MTREEKVAEMVELRKKIANIYYEIVEDEEKLKFKKCEHKLMRSNYEKMDMELALEDERFTRVNEGTKTIKSVTKTLTIDEILGIAAQLGVEIKLPGVNKEL